MHPPSLPIDRESDSHISTPCFPFTPCFTSFWNGKIFKCSKAIQRLMVVTKIEKGDLDWDRRLQTVREKYRECFLADARHYLDKKYPTHGPFCAQNRGRFFVKVEQGLKVRGVNLQTLILQGVHITAKPPPVMGKDPTWVSSAGGKVWGRKKPYCVWTKQYTWQTWQIRFWCHTIAVFDLENPINRAPTVWAKSQYYGKVAPIQISTPKKVGVCSTLT